MTGYGAFAPEQRYLTSTTHFFKQMGNSSTSKIVVDSFFNEKCNKYEGQWLTRIDSDHVISTSKDPKQEITSTYN